MKGKKAEKESAFNHIDQSARQSGQTGITMETEQIYPGRERAWIELDREALCHNIRTLRAGLPEGCELMPAVKANAYGHGAALIARVCQTMGIRSFCVATAEEGAGLRQQGIDGDILVLGYTAPSRASFLHEFRLTQTVLERSYAEQLNESGCSLKVQVKIDTGMHRLGEAWDRPEEIARIFSCENLNITGAFTHLCADESVSPADMAFTLAQNRAFESCLKELSVRGCVFPKVHALSSYGLMNYPWIGGDYARVGIALYGAAGGGPEQGEGRFLLRPVLSLKARVAQVRWLRPGEVAGYGLKFTAWRNSRIAVLTIGYGDGLPRGLSCGVGSVLIKGRRAPIVGSICMDQTLVEVTDLPEICSGDEVVLIGSSGKERITARDLAEQTGTIPNEILSRLGERPGRMMV